MKSYQFVTLKIEQDECVENPRDAFDNVSTFYGAQGREIVGGKNDVEYRYREDLDNELDNLRRAGAVIVESFPRYAVIEPKTGRAEWGRKWRKMAEKCCRAELDEFESWANGEVYGYIVEDLDGEHLDSCWGFYGEKYAIEEGESSADLYEKKFTERAAQIESRLESVTR
jgi:hypothetical protein